MDEEERYELGEFETAEAAIAAAFVVPAAETDVVPLVEINDDES